MEPGLLIAISTTVGGGILFIINRTIQVTGEFDNLKDSLRTEILTRENEDKDIRRSAIVDNDSLRKDIEHKLELQSQQQMMNADRVSEALVNLERTVAALHRRLDGFLEKQLNK